MKKEYMLEFVAILLSVIVVILAYSTIKLKTKFDYVEKELVSVKESNRLLMNQLNEVHGNITTLKIYMLKSEESLSNRIEESKIVLANSVNSLSASTEYYKRLLDNKLTLIEKDTKYIKKIANESNEIIVEIKDKNNTTVEKIVLENEN